MADQPPKPYRTSPGEPLAPLPRACGRCGGPLDAAGACRRRCDLDKRVVRSDDKGPDHPSGGGAE